MANVVVMPKAGNSMEEGAIVEWLKQEGDLVEKGEPLVMIMSDKVNLEIESDYAGVLVRILAMPDDGEIPILEPIAVLADPGEIVDVEQVVANYRADR